ncbi:hypothetical protein EDB89DRAFT_1905747 [Lactarius sanguifluus]|nr:hypothetical protein EDB89DRAFT_1905747 [Lactarius sanguifluus]
MGSEAATKALLDAGNVLPSHRPSPTCVHSRPSLVGPGITYDSVEAAFVGYVYGASTKGQAALYQLGLTGIPITNVNNNCSTGSTALVHAVALVRARDARSLSASNAWRPERSAPNLRSPTDPAPWAHLSQSRKYSGGVEHLAKIAAKNHKHSVNNPYAQFRVGYDEAAILASRKSRTSSPSSCAAQPPLRINIPRSFRVDGAVCCILANEAFVHANRLENQAIELVATGLATDCLDVFAGRSDVRQTRFSLRQARAGVMSGLSSYTTVSLLTSTEGKGAGSMQAPGLFDLPDAWGMYDLVHNTGLSGAVVVSLLRRPDFYHADGPDGRAGCGHGQIQVALRRAIATCKVVRVVPSIFWNVPLRYGCVRSMYRAEQDYVSWSRNWHKGSSLLLCTVVHCPYYLMGTQSGSPFSIPGDSSSGAASHISQGRRKKQKNIRAQGKSYRPSTMINMLPDDVLLEIFDLCQERYSVLDAMDHVWGWHFLGRVCRRWRQIIFESPHRLNLRIFCTYGTPVRKNLGIWPALPIVMDYADYNYLVGVPPNDEDNVVAALEHPDRVSYLALGITGSQLDKMAAMMQEPFSVLKGLYIRSDDEDALVLPAKFLGGSAPRLQSIILDGILLSASPTLLLSATDLVWLHLFNLPPTCYIAPKAMAACLAVLPRLESIVIEFQSATPRPDRISLPPATRMVLPALTFFRFVGASEYLEDLVAQIDSPQLDRIKIDYFDQFFDFQVTQLSKFIDRSVLSYDSVTFSNVVRLELTVFGTTHSEQLEGTDDVAWLHLFHQFSIVQTLHVSRELAGHIALVLEHITGELAADVFPSLDSIYLACQPASSIRNFIAARQLFDRPITVVNTKMEFDERLESYVSE